ncbi:MAG: pilus assembly protein PilM [Burkholderiales bacterium]
MKLPSLGMKLPSLGALKKLKLPGSVRRMPGVMCINLWPDRVDVSHVVSHGVAPGNERPEIKRCDYYRKVGGEAAVLTRLRRDLQLERYRCTTLLKSGTYQIIQVEAPNGLPEEMKSAVRWRIKDMIDFPVDEATVDSVSIPGTEGVVGHAAQMLVVAARNPIIAAAVKPFNDADIPLEIIDIPEFAQRNIARCLEPEGRGVALLSLDDRGGLLTFTCGGELYQHRRIEVTLANLRGAGPAEEESADVRLEMEGPYERLAVELQRSIDHFDRQFPRVSVAKLILTPVPGVEKLRNFLGNRLDLPVELLYLSEVMDFPDIAELHEPARQAQCLHAIGAALRQEAA